MPYRIQVGSLSDETFVYYHNGGQDEYCDHYGYQDALDFDVWLHDITIADRVAIH